MGLRIAGMQTVSIPLDIVGNLARIHDAATEAAGLGVDVLITPEMFTTGYDIAPQLRTLACEDIVGGVKEIAAATGVAVIAGVPEFVGEDVYNTAVFVDKQGTLLSRYRKTHLFGALDRSMFRPGDQPPEVVDYRGVRIAMFICYDIEFPEAAREACLRGADLLVVPTAQMVPFEIVAEQVVVARSWENQVYLAYVNFTGVEGELSYVGRSSIIGPDGVLLDSRLEDPGLVVADIDPELVRVGRSANPYLEDRRGELYFEGEL